jgi:hypothetical protein
METAQMNFRGVAGKAGEETIREGQVTEATQDQGVEAMKAVGAAAVASTPQTQAEEPIEAVE